MSGNVGMYLRLETSDYVDSAIGCLVLIAEYDHASGYDSHPCRLKACGEYKSSFLYCFLVIVMVLAITHTVES